MPKTPLKIALLTGNNSLGEHYLVRLLRSEFENVIVSPHIAGVTSDANYNMATFAAYQWDDIFTGKMKAAVIFAIISRAK